MRMRAMGCVFMPTAILCLNLNGAVADLEIVLQHIRHILKNLLTVTDALICHDDVATANNQP